MAFEKITALNSPIAALDDRVTGQAAALKAYFDANPEQIRVALNALIDALGAADAAEQIGFAPTTRIDAENVQDAIEAVDANVQSIVGGLIPNQSVTTARLADGAVTEAKIAGGAVTQDKLGADVAQALTAWQANRVSSGEQTVQLALADRTEYTLTGVATLSVTYPAGAFACWLDITMAAEGTVTVTLPQDTEYAGDMPEFAAGKRYEMSVKNGVVIAVEVTGA